MLFSHDSAQRCNPFLGDYPFQGLSQCVDCRFDSLVGKVLQDLEHGVWFRVKGFHDHVTLLSHNLLLSHGFLLSHGG